MALAWSGLLVLAALVQAGTPAFDPVLMGWLHARATPECDRFFTSISRIGYEAGVIPADILLLTILLLRRRWRTAAFGLLAIVGAALLLNGLKHAIARARPRLWEVAVPESSWSFPSGHATASMTLILVLIVLAWPTRLRWPVLASLLPFALLVGLSRLYLGVHHPSDVLAGWCLACGWVGLVAHVMPPRPSAG